jgi:hypothetical protein
MGTTLAFGAGGKTSLTIVASDPKIVTAPTSKYGKKPVNGRYVTVTVKIKAADDADPDLTHFNPLDFYLVDGSGQRYQRNDGNVSGSVDLDKALHYGDLNGGEQVTGTLSFDAPDGPLRLAYAPNNKVLGYWAVVS